MHKHHTEHETKARPTKCSTKDMYFYDKAGLKAHLSGLSYWCISPHTHITCMNVLYMYCVVKYTVHCKNMNVRYNVDPSARLTH